MSLNQAITNAIEIKCDTTCFNELLSIRKKARAMGITDIDARIRRINLARQKPKPEPVEPVKQKEPENEAKEQCTAHDSKASLAGNSEMARKTTKRYEPPARRKDSDSKILAMADAKKKG